MINWKIDINSSLEENVSNAIYKHSTMRVQTNKRGSKINSD